MLVVGSAAVLQSCAHLEPVTAGKKAVVLAPKTIDGGIFVPFDAWKPCKPFYVYEGTPAAVQKAQEPVKVTLVDASSKKRVTATVE